MVSEQIELLSIYGFQIFISLTFRVRLVHSNDYYTVIGISITRNRISYNGISITIHQFSCYDLFKFLAAAFWWLLGLILLAVFLFDCFLAALFHHHRCGDVVRSFFMVLYWYTYVWLQVFAVSILG